MWCRVLVDMKFLVLVTCAVDFMGIVPPLNICITLLTKKIKSNYWRTCSQTWFHCWNRWYITCFFLSLKENEIIKFFNSMNYLYIYQNLSARSVHLPYKKSLQKMLENMSTGITLYHSYPLSVKNGEKRMVNTKTRTVNCLLR